MIFINIILLIPSQRRKMAAHFTDQLSMPGEDFINSSFGWRTWKTFMAIANNSHLVAEQKAFLGGKAPDANVISVDGKTQCKLLDFMKPGRPLINFGSCS
jgi:hypothetical protein